MKKTSYFLVLCLIAFQGFAQESKHLVKYRPENFKQVLETRTIKPKKAITSVKSNEFCKYDSIVGTSWDTTTNAWRAPEFKHVFTYNNSNFVLTDTSYYNSGTEWFKSNLDTYAYDQNNNVTLELSQGYNGNTLINWYKVESTFDNLNNRTSRKNFQWNNGQWSIQSDYISDFNNAGYETMYRSFYYSADTLMGADSSIMTYDANNNPILSVSYDWNFATNTWGDPSYKSEATFDVNNHYTSYVSYNWENGTWVGSYRVVSIQYDGMNNISSYISQYYDNGLWINEDKTEITYIAYDKPTLSIDYNWNQATSTWANDYKGVYTYDGFGNQNSYNSYEWDTLTSQWGLSYTTEHTYNANNVESYNLTASDWETRTNVYTFCPNNICYATRIEEVDSPGNFYQKQLYNYFGCIYTLDANTLQADVLSKVYPNPTQGKLTVEFEAGVSGQLHVLNALGQEIVQHEINSSVQVDLSQQPAGVFFLQAQLADGSVQTSKVIVE